MTPARKYLRDRRLPSEMRQKHTWRTRPDPFADSWEEIRQLLAVEPGLQAKTLFEHLQQVHPGRFSDGQVRTLRRRISYWRATEGPPREVFFAQEHRPGELCQSDFTHCRELGVTINGQAFPHLIYHFVLTLFQLGDRQHLLLGDVREPERRAAECTVATGRRSCGTSNGPDERGGE